jgi:energy-coupling factor transport system permease protein
VIPPRTPRALHPFAWWCWAGGVAVAASRTTNPFLLVPLAMAVGYVVAARRTPSPWQRSFALFLRIAVIALAVRVVLFALLGTGPGSEVLFRLPVVPLPDWLAGVRLGGPVSLDGVLYATYDGLRLGVVLLCIGAANALTNPRRLMKTLPPALYEAGVALTVALSVAPQAVATLGRLRTARRLRGREDRGLRALGGLAVPVLEGSLDRSVDLAASMDSRGFGRIAPDSATRSRGAAVATTTGLVAALGSSYALVDRSAPQVLGVPLLLGAATLLLVGLLLGRGRGRTRYRPDPWAAAEWAVVVATAGCVALVAGASSAALHPATTPPGLPGVSVAALVGVLLAALPAVLSPPVRAPEPMPTVVPRAMPVGAP